MYIYLGLDYKISNEAKPSSGKMMKVFLIVVLIATVAMAVERGPVVADPKGDCTTVLFDMDDCIPFITVGSEKKKPTKECCSDFKRVLKSNAECVCEALQLSSEMGLNFDRTRVMSLPSACRVSSSYPPIPDCHYKAPVVETPSEAPSVIGGGTGGSPASSPSGAHVVTATPILFLVSIFFLSFLH